MYQGILWVGSPYVAILLRSPRSYVIAPTIEPHRQNTLSALPGRKCPLWDRVGTKQYLKWPGSCSCTLLEEIPKRYLRGRERADSRVPGYPGRNTYPRVPGQPSSLITDEGTLMSLRVEAPERDCTLTLSVSGVAQYPGRNSYPGNQFPKFELGLALVLVVVVPG
eukprot:3092983-Rhodomonas_salina.1